MLGCAVQDARMGPHAALGHACKALLRLADPLSVAGAGVRAGAWRCRDARIVRAVSGRPRRQSTIDSFLRCSLAKTVAYVRELFYKSIARSLEKILRSIMECLD